MEKERRMSTSGSSYSGGNGGTRITNGAHPPPGSGLGISGTSGASGSGSAAGPGRYLRRLEFVEKELQLYKTKCERLESQVQVFEGWKASMEQWLLESFEVTLTPGIGTGGSIPLKTEKEDVEHSQDKEQPDEEKNKNGENGVGSISSSSGVSSFGHVGADAGAGGSGRQRPRAEGSLGSLDYRASSTSMHGANETNEIPHSSSSSQESQETTLFNPNYDGGEIRIGRVTSLSENDTSANDGVAAVESNNSSLNDLEIDVDVVSEDIITEDNVINYTASNNNEIDTQVLGLQPSTVTANTTPTRSSPRRKQDKEISPPTQNKSNHGRVIATNGSVSLQIEPKTKGPSPKNNPVELIKTPQSVSRQIMFSSNAPGTKKDQNQCVDEDDEISIVFASPAPKITKFGVASAIKSVRSGNPQSKEKGIKIGAETSSAESGEEGIHIDENEVDQDQVEHYEDQRSRNATPQNIVIEPSMPMTHNLEQLSRAEQFDMMLVETDDPTPCGVCMGVEPEYGNEMVFCDKCNLCVHQACYGVRPIPPGGWKCNPCKAGLDTLNLKCYFCPELGSALKPVKSPSGRNWAHVSCSLWIPEVKPENDRTMEPIIGVQKIPTARWKLKCSLCKDKTGACIQCQYSKRCTSAFHVTCAMKRGLNMNQIVSDEITEGVSLQAFCKKHTYINTNKNKTKRRSSSSPRKGRNTDSATTGSPKKKIRKESANQQPQPEKTESAHRTGRSGGDKNGVPGEP